MPTVEERLKKQFPTLANLYQNVPEVWAVLIWATETGMAPAEVQAAIQNTGYYRSRTEAQQRWDRTATLNPAEADRLLQQSVTATRQMSLRLGTKLTNQQINYIALGAAQNEWSVAELRDTLVTFTRDLPEAQRKPGEFTGTMTKVRSLADEYAMPVSDKEAAAFASRLLKGGSVGGGMNEEALRDVFKRRAASLYPHLQQELEAGVTIAEWAEPYKAMAERELGISAETITFNDPKWKAMLEGNIGGEKAEGRPKTALPLTLAQWQTKLRTDKRYGFDHTVGGKSAAYGIADAILSAFGNRG